MPNTREKLRELIDQYYIQNFAPTNQKLTGHLIANGVTVQKWISVKDRLPVEESKAYELEWKEYPMYIVMIDMAFLPNTLYYDWRKDVWFDFRHDGEIDEYDVTHWMPLPEPPKEV